MKYLLLILLFACMNIQAVDIYDQVSGSFHHQQIVLIGEDFPVDAQNNNGVNTTILKINGGILLKEGVSGPNYADGVCGIQYRITGELNMDPALVYRCNTYMWEGDGESTNGGRGGGNVGWDMVLNDSGLCVGCWPHDFPGYPVDRFSVKRGDMSFQALPGFETNTIIWRDKNHKPKWRMGVFEGSPNFRILKFKNGVWTVMMEMEY